MPDDLVKTDNYDEQALQIACVLSGNGNPPKAMVEAVRKGLPHPPTPGFKHAREAAQLIEIMRGPGTYQDKKAEMHKIGSALFRKGGFRAMQATAMEVRWQFPSGEKKPAKECFGEGDDYVWHPQSIDWAWDGIGPWKP